MNQSIKQTTLSNGLRIITSNMPFIASVNVGVWIGTGTRAETIEINGAAHYLEHMAFKGTTTRTARDIALEVENVGGYINAYTARENTAYYLRILKDDLPMSIDILSDILQNPTFISGEMERERGVIQQEIGQAYDTPDDIIFDHFQAVAYPDQPMGWPILGTTETVSNMRREQLIDFMNQRYRPGNMVVAAAGPIDHDHFCQLVGEKFSDMTAQEIPEIQKAQYIGGDFRDQKESEQIHFKLGFDGVSYHDEDRYASKVLATLLGGGSSSRLFEEIREKRGLVYSIYSYSDFYKDSGLFGIYAGTGADEISELIPVLCDSLNDCRHNILEDELIRAKSQLKAMVLMGMESNDAQANQLGASLLSFNHYWTMEELSRKIDEVSVHDVKRVAERHFSSLPSVAAIGPIRKLETYAHIKNRL